MVNTDWLRGRLSAEQVQARHQRYESRALLHEAIEPDDAARTAWWAGNRGGHDDGPADRTGRWL